MSRLAEIVAFLSLADGALAPEVQEKTIRRRWPEASVEEIRQAAARAAAGLPEAAEERAAMEAAVRVMLGRTPLWRDDTPSIPKSFEMDDAAVRAPFRRAQ